MRQDMTETVAFLLAEAAEAHRQYEKAMLRGRADADWPEWCAEFLMAGGLEQMVGDGVSAEEVGELLRYVEEEYTRGAVDEPWADYAARRIVGELAMAGAD